MEELKKDKNYIDAKRNQSEGISHMQTSCITCKFKPDYLGAIPSLRTAADTFFGFSNSKPALYKEILVIEEAKCREKLIVCLDKERSLIEAGEQGFKLANIYINFFRSFDLAYKTMENFNLSFIQSSSIGNNAVKRSLKNISEIAISFAKQGADDYTEKTYAYLFDTAFSVFPGQVKENEPYEYLYKAFADYFDSLILKKEFEQLLKDILKTIELVSPTKEQLFQKESVMGKDSDIDNIINLHFKLIICCACMEDQEKFEAYWSEANELKSDSTHTDILDALRDIFSACMNGEEKNFERNLKIVESISSIAEGKELRSIMKKYKKYQREDEVPKSLGDGYLGDEITEQQQFRKQKENLAEKNFEAKIELKDMSKQIQNLNKGLNANFEKLNHLDDFGHEFKKLSNTSSDLIHRHTEEINHIQPSLNDRQKKYEIKEEDEENEEKDFVVNLDNHEGNIINKEFRSYNNDYL